MALYFVLPKGGLAQSCVFTALWVTQLAGIWLALRIARPARPDFWYVLLAGQALELLGNVTWYVVPVAQHTLPGFPSISDGMFLGSYGFSAAALVVLIRSRGGGQGRADLLDAAIITLGLAAVSWVYLIVPNLDQSDLDLGARAVSLAYPLSDLILLGLAIRLGASAGARSPAHWLVILWIGSQLAADWVFAVLTLGDAFTFGSLVFGGWMLQVVLLPTAALHPSMTRLASPVPAPPPGAYRSRLVMLGAASLIPLALILLDLLDPVPDDTVVLVGLSALLFLLVIFRMGGLMQRVVDDRAALEREVAVRLKAEALLREQAADLERSNAELEQFAYVASHDLQEPLRMVGSYVSLLKRRYQGKLGADADEFIEFAVDGVTRMQSLIKDLLVYSRAARYSRPAEPADAGDALRTALANLQAAIEASGARVSQLDLPRLPLSPLQLTQLFQNLIGNAIKFCRDRPPEVEVGAESRNGEWLVFVRDNGIGIEPQYRERIFQIFQRLHKRGEYPGTGIGLAICKKIIDGAGGRIWVESEPGKGSTFFFTLPQPEWLPMAA